MPPPPPPLLLFLPLLLLLLPSSSASLLPLHPAHPCNNVNCGRGQCVNHTLLPGIIGYYSCRCDPGWTSPFALPLAPCVLPNCTVHQSCDNPSSLTSPPPEASPPAPVPPSGFNACLFPVCGNGQCVSHSLLSYSCECDTGYSNVFNASSGYCLRECQLGADCSNLGINIKGNSSNQAPPTNQGIPSGLSPTSQGIARGPSFPSSGSVDPPLIFRCFMQVRPDHHFMLLPGLLLWALWR